MTRRILVLGGTAEARELASRLSARGFPVTTSLAGRTRHPRLPAGGVRSGGFGGVDGLAAALGEVDVLVDATRVHRSPGPAVHPGRRSTTSGVPVHAAAAAACSVIVAAKGCVASTSTSTSPSAAARPSTTPTPPERTPPAGRRGCRVRPASEL
ncbi:MAG: Precorrin-6A reductase, partial [uncultured Actinomycetospora sp.]